ncbi:MAG TPA: hypothetical protein VK464_02320 [Symbiobacteriaceae bacterium]|jgi:hypothetical protein|nr:hypothetical protein [Symbiobacteriaceae bacterium]
MSKGFPGKVLLVLLMTAALFVTACSAGKRPEAGPVKEAPALDEVRRLAETALNATLPTQQRQQARADAMTKLLALLRHADSTRIPKEQWEQKVGPGAQSLVRYFEAGSVRVYGLALPGSGVVPPGERVVIQYVAGVGNPTAQEVEVLPGGQLAGVLPLDDRSVLLAFGLARGGGYLGHYYSDNRSGEYQPDSTAWRGLPPAVGEVRLEPKGNFLVVDVPTDAQWRPQVDQQKRRFYVNADLGMEWKGKYTLIDDRSFTAFDGFLTAANPSASKEERTEAWEKATRKLPAYLSSMESLSDNIAAKLPPGARLWSGEGPNMSVRVVSLPAPEAVGRKGFTVVQTRTGGLPQAQVLELPGVVEGFRVVEHGGLPGLMLLVAPPDTPAKRVTLMRLTGANDWEPAPDWYGFLPAEGPQKFSRPAGTADLIIEGATGVGMSTDGTIQVCEGTTCYTLTWLGGRLTAAGWVAKRLQQVTLPGATAAQVEGAADLLRQYLLTPETEGLTAAQVIAALPGAGLQGWDLVGGGRALALPYNTTGVTPLVVQSGKAAHIQYHEAGAIHQWTDVREIEAGGVRWLLALGRTPDRAALVVSSWNGSAWAPVNALDEPADKTIGEWSKITYTPGQTRPVRGLYATGHDDLQAYFTPQGNSVAFCEASRPCTVYQFATNRWVLK